ncbi:hypothetical protein [Amycolatopsis sp. NPDC098790]|uniref:hypothetical protein n=1 Tax=Amycolatopsis sp. NPDC098790 TaxID=3363939 RepID=UPI00381E1381
MTRAATTGRRIETPRRGDPATQQRPGSASADLGVVAATEVVTRYIPTEIITAYVAVATLVMDPGGSRTGQWVMFSIFLVLTPVIVWLFAVAQARKLGRTPPWRPGDWPVFELITATISFGLWAFTLPATPFEDFSWYRPGYGTAALIVGSLLIGAIAYAVKPKP